MTNEIILELRRIRREKKVTQQQVAGFCNISQPAIARTEFGDIDPHLSTVTKICNLLGVEMVLRPKE